MISVSSQMKIGMSLLRVSIGLACLIGLVTSCSNQSASSSTEGNWPTRPIAISCFAAAGGGTDMISRLTAAFMEKDLGVRVNVVNRTAGAGAEAINYVQSRKHDGYNWGGFAESILNAAVLGTAEATSKDWAFFIVAGSPGVLSVRPDSQFKDLQGLVEHAIANPDSVKISAAMTGSVWHLKLLGLQTVSGAKFRFIPFNRGSNPAQMAALSGEVDAVLTSISEQSELIAGGRLKPLAMVEASSYDFEGHGVISAAADLYPTIADQPIQQFLGIALPSDAPEAILQKLTQSFQRFIKSDALRLYCDQHHLELLGHYGERSDELCYATECQRSWQLSDLGIAVKSPTEFGIPRQ
jgi:tripartite-type tricarboxylate transporter receptor subunit TctC